MERTEGFVEEIGMDGSHDGGREVRSAEALATAMERIAAMSPAERGAMGASGRRKVAAEFDQKLVASAYLAEAALVDRGR